MSEKPTPATVVAAIDGSPTALHAAQWAAEEAVARNVPLRLVYVTKATHPSVDDYYADVHHGRISLEQAKAALESAEGEAKIETAMVDGPPGQALVDESRHASLICLGSLGIGRYAESILGSTAWEVAEKAHCPTAIIRAGDDVPASGIRWIVFALHDSCDPDVIDEAMLEARLRHAPVLVLGDRHSRNTFDANVDDLKRRFPDVHLYPVTNEADVPHFLRKHDEPVQLAVISGADTAQLPQILGPYGHHKFHIFDRATASVLVARHTP